jgi:hypothetical protein
MKNANAPAEVEAKLRKAAIKTLRLNPRGWK